MFVWIHEKTRIYDAAFGIVFMWACVWGGVRVLGAPAHPFAAVLWPNLTTCFALPPTRNLYTMSAALFLDEIDAFFACCL